MERPLQILTLIALQLCFFLPMSARASHFRGGLITWRPTGNPNQITVDYRMSWRRSMVRCDDDTIADGNLVGSGSLSCINNGGSPGCDPGCYATMGTMSIRCTDYSESEDWMTGVNSYDITFESDGCFELGYGGCCWITLVYGGGSWSVVTRVDLTPRADTGTVNSSPIAAMAPIVRMQYGCNDTITIPVSDADGDHVRCRWAVDDKECGDMCNGFPAAVLDERACVLHVSGTAISSTGWYGVAVQIEDFADQSSTDALSSVPLQFLVEVFSGPDACHANKPFFVLDTPLDGACHGVPLGDTFVTSLVAQVGSPERSISEITTLSPHGFVKSPIEVNPDNSEQYYVNITWTPIATQQGPNIFCFYAVDSVGLTSNQRCVTIVVGSEAVEPPSVVSVDPQGVVAPNTSTWTVTFNKAFVRPHQTTMLHFIDEATGQSVQSLDVSTSQAVEYPLSENDTTLAIHTSVSFVEGNFYYILWEEGLATGTSACLEGSTAVTDPTFWRFQTAVPTTTTTTTVATTTTTVATTTTTRPLDCSTCDYFQSVCYMVDPENCQCYYRCQQYPDGSHIRHDQQCCPTGLLWDSAALTCNWPAGVVTSGCKTAPATPPPLGHSTTTAPDPDNNCPYPVDPSDPSRYIMYIPPTQHVSMPCGVGMVWDEEACICDSGNSPPAGGGCVDEFLLSFTFDETFHDVGCQKAYSDQYGNPQLGWDAKKNMALQLDGRSRLAAEFLTNWFASQDIRDWSVSLWFKSTTASGARGLVANSNCEGQPGFTMYLDPSGKLVADINTDSGHFQVTSPTTVSSYDWHYAAMVYNGDTLVLYLNGAEVRRTKANGSMLNTHCPLTMGQAGSDPEQGFLLGFMDQVLIYDEELPASDITSLYHHP